MTPALTHIAMHVEDLARSVEFYEQYCGMTVCHRRESDDSRVVWLAEPGKHDQFIIVMIDGGRVRNPPEDDYSHLGFAAGSREEVDRIAERARLAGCLVWPPREEPYPVGYYCGLRDPAGYFVEFSYGQPLGPGAPGG